MSLEIELPENEVAELEAIQMKPSSWPRWQLVLFRFAALYIVLQVVPLDWKFYQQLFIINWLEVSYADVFQLARYYPRILSGADTYWNWVIIGIISAVGTYFWTKKDTEKVEYNSLYYSVRVIARYRLAAGLIAYGFLKLYALQAPQPTLSQLNTALGDFSAWKIFVLSIGVVPSYQSFLGATEIVAGLLLLYRKTATIGAFLGMVFLGNVFVSNLAYEGGEDVYSLYLITLAVFLLTFDLSRLIQLYRGVQVIPNTFQPVWIGNLKLGRLVLKGTFISFFIVFYGWKVGAADRSYHLPQVDNTVGWAGVYQVLSYKENNEIIAPDPQHPSRWQDVVIEQWPTLSIRSNRVLEPVAEKIEVVTETETARLYEVSETLGRHFYSFSVNESSNQLSLVAKNNHGVTLQFQFEQIGEGQLKWNGLDDRGIAIEVILQKIDRRYLQHRAAKTGRLESIIY